MTLPLFYLDSLPGELGAHVRLEGPEGRHAAVVRRVGVGEKLSLSDGAGAVATCSVRAVDAKGLTCEVLARSHEAEPQPRIVVVQALPKGERGEVAVEAMTEVGVDVIVPWAASRCIARWRDERVDKGRARWQVTARESAKQSRRARIPLVLPLESTALVAARLAAAARALVLHEDAAVPISAVSMPTTGDVVLVVGPEGGISAEELDMLGAQPVRLGPSVLRTSTAGPVAAAAVLSRTPRWA